MTKLHQQAKTARNKCTIALVMAAGCLMFGVAFHMDKFGASFAHSPTIHQDTVSTTRELIGATSTKTKAPTNPPAANPSSKTTKAPTTPAPASPKPSTPPPTSPKPSTPPPTSPKPSTPPPTTPKSSTPPPTTPKPSTPPPTTPAPTTKRPAASASSIPIGSPSPGPTPTPTSTKISNSSSTAAPSSTLPTLTPTLTTSPTGTLPTGSNATSMPTTTPPTGTPKLGANTSMPTTPPAQTSATPVTTKPVGPASTNGTSTPPKPVNTTTGNLTHSTITPRPTGLASANQTISPTGNSTARPSVNGTSAPSNSTVLPTGTPKNSTQLSRCAGTNATMTSVNGNGTSCGNSTGQFIFKRKKPTDCKTSCDTTIVTFSCYDTISNAFVTDDKCQGVELTPQQKERNGKRVPCGGNLCGTNTCTVRRELRVANGQDPTPIPYRICNDHGFYGAIDYPYVTPTEMIREISAVKKAPTCAEECLRERSCQWFGHSESEEKCKLFKKVFLDGVDENGKTVKAEDVDMDQELGFVLAAPPDYLNRKMKCTETRPMTGSGEGRMLCLAASWTAVMPNTDSECGAGPWTLYRRYLLDGQVSVAWDNTEKFEEAMDEPDKYFTIISNPANLVPIETFKFQSPTTPLTTWTYHYDEHGRVVSAKGEMSSRSIVDGTLYRKNAFQDNFRKAHDQSDSLTFSAGHVVGNQFTCPNSFWNFVPQSCNSNSDNGCWGMAETQVQKLLEIGCIGEMKAKMQYFAMGDLKKIDDQAVSKTQAAQAAGLTTIIELKDIYQPNRAPQGSVSYPCNYFYRPLLMDLDFTITRADPDSQCEKGLHALTRDQNQFFSRSPGGSVTITRVFADWSMGGKESKFTPLMGFATTKAEMCLAETGAKLNTLEFSNAFQEAYLVHRASKQCVVCDATTNTLGLEPCNPQNAQHKWTAIENGSTGRCNAVFVYDYPAITYDPNDPLSWSSVTLTNGKLQIGGTNVALSGTDEVGVLYDYTKNRDGKPADGKRKRDPEVVQSCYSLRSKRTAVGGT